MLLGIPRSARCVQRFDDSLNSAIHITYRISLRSSSMREPRDPLLKVVLCFRRRKSARHSLKLGFWYAASGSLLPSAVKVHGGFVRFEQGREPAARPFGPEQGAPKPRQRYVNDPSAGSPTETLLRLLLPLNDQV
jgi:hypothetical protein